MLLSPGQRLGPYEIVASLGSGGMGEVYRARDSRLEREVAVKVLAESISRDPDARARFEREARAVAALSHPNILAIHDLGREGDLDYAVMELLEGGSLKERLSHGPLPAARAVEISTQVAQGLAAAHERGIAHRDLKPENLFLTTSGLVKILDFGLAVQTAPSLDADTRSPTLPRLTSPGMVVGTVGYMSPEQVRGAPADHRSDVFSFGCVLYEMICGQRAFQRETGAETMTAILREEPEPPSAVKSNIPPVIEQLILHCLEKDPAQRFQSMKDVGFTLRTLPGASSGTQPRPHVPAPTLRPRNVALLAMLLLVLVALGWLVITGMRTSTSPPSFQKLTFQRGTIYSARFSPDGHTVVYGANWRGAGLALYSTRLDAGESRPLGVTADILGISASGEMALSLGRETIVSLMSVGRLARAPLGGGAPREILDGVLDADWSADGTELAVTREVDGEARLEYPIGRVLHRSGGYLSSPRISPDGHLVAFIKHQVKGDDRGSVAMVDQDAEMTTLSADLPSVTGLAWSPDGSEIWFSAWIPAVGYAIEGVTPEGRHRTVFSSGVRARLFDVRGNKTLIGHESTLAGVSGLLRGQEREADLSFLDGTAATDLAAEGDQMLFSEAWIGGGPRYSFFLRRASSPYPVRLGEGWGSDLSADGQQALSYPVDPPMALVISPSGPGTPRTLELPDFEAIGGASWFPDGERILVWASKPGEAFRGYLLDAEEGQPSAITPPGIVPPLFSNASHPLSPDGLVVATSSPEKGVMLYPVDGSEPSPAPGGEPRDLVVGWVDGGRGLLVRRQGELPARVYRLDQETGRRELWKELMPVDPAGVLQILGVVTTPDTQFYAYTYLRALTELYVVEGLD